MSSAAGPKTVLVHEWLSEFGGSERVFDALVAAIGDADVLALWDDASGGRYPGRRLRETWLASTPLRRNKALAMPLMPLTWRLRRGDYDRAVISSHAFAHHVRFMGARRHLRKFAYVHTPARYVWTPDLDRRHSVPFQSLLARPFRALDKSRAQEIYSIAANSEYIRSRIQQCWGRASHVIYPPVDTELIGSQTDWASLLAPQEAEILNGLPDQFLLGASRLVPYKRLDMVIQTGEQLSMPTVIAGGGPEATKLALAGESARQEVFMVPDPSDALLYSLYQRASVLMFPPIEDFGIMPVEALAAGTPIVVNPRGGAAEIPEHGVSGVVSAGDDVGSFAVAVKLALTLDRQACRDRASRFSTSRFISEIDQWLDMPAPDNEYRARRA
ncbi:glycosyltransferase [Cellulomonas dongxiuzhuiae]|uniref:D-inositol 3-phosphate glycosyltransferase n=1 Tax=Cellulomonas dongxiuzhuiae TaxID=2819979 RepID=A0ABX8GM65_9CELL|nr:glycosyltransferase [Cellulomonas dongxiuzhuiae]MBO3096358.1 glycosyltransferase [Cellulomonas dongxiuzhuiae]QWC16771.1 glycosyltransferase [Cellulomonas dongxiuzhuiae]